MPVCSVELAHKWHTDRPLFYTCAFVEALARRAEGDSGPGLPAQVRRMKARYETGTGSRSTFVSSGGFATGPRGWAFEFYGARANLAFFTSLNECRNHRSIVSRVDKALNALDRSFKLHSALVRAVRRHSVKGVGHRDYLRHQRNFVTM